LKKLIKTITKINIKTKLTLAINFDSVCCCTVNWLIVQLSCKIKELTNERSELVDSIEVTAISDSILQHATKLALQALCMLRQIRPSVRPFVNLSVCHTPVLCQNERTQKDAVFTFGQPNGSSFLMPTMVAGDDPVQVKLECKEVNPLRKQPSCTHFAS